MIQAVANGMVQRGEEWVALRFLAMLGPDGKGNGEQAKARQSKWKLVTGDPPLSQGLL